MKTLVLTSKENFVWHSMQEIIPALERTWELSGHLPDHEVSCMNVDQMPLKDLLSTALKADNLVLTCFNHKLARTAVTLRGQFGLDSRFFIYLHNQATIACWPFHHWGLGNILREDDVFFSSCALDQKTLSLCFENARAELIPFTHLNPPQFLAKEQASHRPPPFIYVGRLSEQKNIPTLIEAFALFLNAHPSREEELYLYGGEDDLGSPNMGIKSGPVLERLQTLVETYGLQKKVHFKGHFPRSELHHLLTHTPHIFVSPSLHSDENFGMAAFFSLSLGMPAVLSKWGGHVDFIKYFPEQVHPVSVYGEDKGPWMDPQELAQALFYSVKDFRPILNKDLPSYYSENTVSKTLYQLAMEPLAPGAPLHMTALAKKILEQKKTWETEDPCKIFESYQDPLVQHFFRAYGMRSVKARKLLNPSASS